MMTLFCFYLKAYGPIPILIKCIKHIMGIRTGIWN